MAGRKCSRRGCDNTVRSNSRYKYCPSCRQENKSKAHDKRIERFGLPAELYWRLYAAQNGRCAIFACKATGKTKFLSVEHAHNCDRGHDPVKECCEYCVRGLTCAMHNGWLGKAGDDPQVFISLAAYLTNPPAQKILRKLRNESLSKGWPG
jgi:Recombination endonuclease VII